MTSAKQIAPLPGLELLYHSVHSKIKSASDAIVCFIHWNLVQNGYRCLINGERKSECLPLDWSQSCDLYELNYARFDSDDSFVLKIVRTGDILAAHFTRRRDEKTNASSIKISDYASENFTQFDHAYRNSSELIARITDELVAPFIECRFSPEMSNRRMPLNDPGIVHPQIPRGGFPQTTWVQPDDPFSVGRRDLDPLAGHFGQRGGGMIMDPFQSPSSRTGFNPYGNIPGLPRGSVPPGARFDPIVPPGLRSDPNPDHLPPPGADDMFL